MTSPRRRLRWLLLAPLAVLTLALFVLIGGLLWLHSSLPQTQGLARIAGLKAEVIIERDGDGIPHIRAQSTDDAYFALGFTHAQDRLWQMETTRRVGAGRLAEVLGAPLLSTDKLMRTLGLYRRAEAIIERASPEVRQAVIAYSAGVNAYLASHEGAWPLEYYLLRLRPEPWRPADSLVWGQLMGLRLAGDWRQEVTRQALTARLGPAQIRDLLEDSGGDGPVTIGDARQHTEPETFSHAASAMPLDPAMIARLTAALPPWLGPNAASNSWVLAGARTTSGMPLLANDPHLALESPNVWYLAKVTAPGLSVSGATAPGVPFHILGHNDRVAWGFTTTGSDVQDLFVEQIAPGDPAQYLTPEGPRPFVERSETIKVRGGADIVLTVRETRHGPVVSDLADEPPAGLAQDQVLALASAGLRDDDRTAEALHGFNRATNWQQFNAALRQFHYPQQNISYADRDGTIAFTTAGRVPIRKAGDGQLPVPGWSGEYDWRGFIPFEDLPQSVNPATQRLINANNRVIGSNYPYRLGRDWSETYRARRIEQVIDRMPRHDMADMIRLQGDVISLAAVDLLPLMLPAVETRGGAAPRADAAIALLKNWTGTAASDLPQPLIFNEWLRELNRAIYGDELGEDFSRLSWALRPRFIHRVLTEATAWCDDIATAPRETCDDRLRVAFDAALTNLADRYGPSPQRWRWGEAHRLRLSHRILGRLPVIGPWTDRVLETPGDDATVNRGTTSVRNPLTPFGHIHGATLRAIYDLGDLSDSRFIIAGGQSGNILSPLYASLAERWRDMGYVSLGEPAAQAHRLRLIPKGRAP